MVVGRVVSEQLLYSYRSILCRSILCPLRSIRVQGKRGETKCDMKLILCHNGLWRAKKCVFVGVAKRQSSFIFEHTNFVCRSRLGHRHHDTLHQAPLPTTQETPGPFYFVLSHMSTPEEDAPVPATPDNGEQAEAAAEVAAMGLADARGEVAEQMTGDFEIIDESGELVKSRFLSFLMN